MPTLPATSQAWHWPLQAALQQTPSTHWLLEHCRASVHAPPLGNFATHWFDGLHQFVEVQLASLVQLDWQAVAPQM